jgi:hypothetical protein
LILTVLLWVLSFSFNDPGMLLTFNDPNIALLTGDESQTTVQQAGLLPPPKVESKKSPFALAIKTIDGFLQRYQVNQTHRGRVAESIVRSSRKYDVDPRLIASITIVESRANPFAVSNADAVGIMQVHLPTWGRKALQEGINLFKIEDNVDFGVRILRDYIRRFGLWEGVKRYKGWNPENPNSIQNAEAYLAKIQHIYSFEKPASELLQ